MSILVGLRFERVRVMAVAVFDLAPALAVLRAEMVAQNREQPSRHVRAGLKRIDIGQCAQQCFLHQVVSAVHVPAERDRECAETWHRTENGFADGLVHRHYCSSFLPLPLRRLISSLKRSGTPWFTTSSYIARSCCPRRACTSRPSLAGFALIFLFRVAAASIGFCCPTGFRSFMFNPNFRAPKGRCSVVPLVEAKPLAGQMVPPERNFFATVALARYRL